MTESTPNTYVLIRSEYENLRASEQRIADYILSNGNEAAYSSISSIAQRCETSETSVIRFCKALNFRGFQDFKISLAKSTALSPHQIHESVEENDDVENIVRKVASANIQAINDTLQLLNMENVQKAIDAIDACQRLEFYGMGGSGCVAIDAQHKFFKYNISCAAYIDSHMQAMSAANLSKGDVVLGISHSGYNQDLLENLETARQSGAIIISITGGRKSAIADASDIVLNIIAREQSIKPEPMSSRIAQLTIIDILSVGVAMRRKDAVIHNLARTRAAVMKKKRPI